MISIILCRVTLVKLHALSLVITARTAGRTGQSPDHGAEVLAEVWWNRCVLAGTCVRRSTKVLQQTELPDVVLDIVIDDGLSDIVAGRFDAGIRVGERLER